MLPIETHRLVLRPVRQADLQAIWRASRVPGLVDGLEWVPPGTRDGLWDQLAAERVTEHWVPLVIVDKAGTFLGRVFLKNYDGEWRLGYWLAPAARGQGYATEAAEAMVRYAFEMLGAARVIATCLPWNEESKRVLMRIGMRKSRVLPGWFVKGGKVQDAEEYGVERDSLMSSRIYAASA